MANGFNNGGGPPYPGHPGQPGQPPYGASPYGAAQPPAHGQPGQAPGGPHHPPGSPMAATATPGGYGPAQGGPPQGPPPGYAPAGHAPQGYGPPQGYAPPPAGYAPAGQPPPYGTPPGYAPPQGHASPPGYPAQGAPGYAPPQGSPGYAPPQGAPGYPPPQGAPGYPPPQGAPGYPPHAGGYAQQGYNQDPFAGLTGGMPTNAWIPGALVSFFFPGLGLLFLPRPELKATAIKIFVGYIACMWALPIGLSIVSSITGVYALGYVGYPFRLVGFLFHLGSMLYTHDAACKINPQLGTPIFFKK